MAWQGAHGVLSAPGMVSHIVCCASHPCHVTATCHLCGTAAGVISRHWVEHVLRRVQQLEPWQPRDGSQQSKLLDFMAGEEAAPRQARGEGAITHALHDLATEVWTSWTGLARTAIPRLLWGAIMMVSWAAAVLCMHRSACSLCVRAGR